MQIQREGLWSPQYTEVALGCFTVIQQHMKVSVYNLMHVELYKGNRNQNNSP